MEEGTGRKEGVPLMMVKIQNESYRVEKEPHLK